MKTEETKCKYSCCGVKYCGEHFNTDAKLNTIISTTRQQTLKEFLDYLQTHHLEYCQEQNGLPYCKNCGLDREDIIKHFEIKL